MNRLGHAARIIAHSDAILSGCQLVRKLANQAEKMFDKSEDQKKINFINSKIENILPWSYEHSSDYSFSTLIYNDVKSLLLENNQIIKKIGEIKANHRQSVGIIHKYFEAQRTLQNMAWKLELEERHELEDGDYTIDADPFTMRMIAYIGFEAEKEYDAIFEKNICIDEIDWESFLEISPARQRQLARRVAQSMIDNEQGPNREISLLVDKKDGLFSSLKIRLESGTFSADVSTTLKSPISGLSDSMIVVNGDYPVTVLDGLMGSDFNKIANHPLFEGLNLKYLGWQSLSKTIPMTALYHDARRQSKLRGLFIIGNEHDKRKSGKVFSDED